MEDIVKRFELINEELKEYNNCGEIVVIGNAVINEMSDKNNTVYKAFENMDNSTSFDILLNNLGRINNWSPHWLKYDAHTYFGTQLQKGLVMTYSNLVVRIISDISQLEAFVTEYEGANKRKMLYFISECSDGSYEFGICRKGKKHSDEKESKIGNAFKYLLLFGMSMAVFIFGVITFFSGYDNYSNGYYATSDSILAILSGLMFVFMAITALIMFLSSEISLKLITGGITIALFFSVVVYASGNVLWYAGTIIGLLLIVRGIAGLFTRRGAGVVEAIDKAVAVSFDAVNEVAFRTDSVKNTTSSIVLSVIMLIGGIFFAFVTYIMFSSNLLYGIIFLFVTILLIGIGVMNIIKVINIFRNMKMQDKY